MTSSTNDDTSTTARPPVLRVVRGRPSPDDLAVLAAVLLAGGGAVPAEETRPSTWAAHWRQVRQPVVPRAGGWRASALPR